jgi:hypothetical protein
MKTTILAYAFGLMFALCLQAAPVQATSTITYVSSSGNDGNDCTSPNSACGSFQHAHDQTTNGGTIICLSSGNFLQVTIGRSITIDCRGHVAKTIDVEINQPNVVVILRGLHIYGAYQSSAVDGVRLVDGNALLIEDCKIAGFTFGVTFTPSGLSRLYVTDSDISENGLPDNSGGSGILIQPTGSGSARATLNRVTMNQNTNGIVVDGTMSTGAITGVVRDSVVTGSVHSGIIAVTTINNSPVTVSLDHTHVTNSGATGVSSQGGAAVILNNSTIQTNGTGLNADSGSAIFSYGNNAINGNQPGGIGTAPIVIAYH